MFKDQGAHAQSSIGNQAVPQPQREGEIVEGLRALGSAIDSMEGAAINLTRRLDPVLLPAIPATTGGDTNQTAGTLFGQELARLQERVWTITRLIDDASGRMQLP